MNKKRAVFALLICLLLVTPPQIAAYLDENSIFLQARIPASILDLELYDNQKIWWERFVKEPDAETIKAHPLITQARVMIQLRNRQDHIEATGWIMNLDGFLKFSAGQRKQLVLNTLDLLKSSLYMCGRLVDKKTGYYTGRSIENHHINLCLIIGDILDDDKRQSIRFSLPNETGMGQAGYKDGQFVFSETYFLNLKVHGGVAVSGDPNKFIIEREK